MDQYVPDYELEDDGIYNQLPALSPIINGPILPSNEVDLLELIWRKGNIAELEEQPLKVLIHELEMELWLHCENKRLEDNLARFETPCMDPMMSVVNYIIPSLEEPLPIMEFSKEDHGMIDDEDDDQMLISVVRGKVFENSKELMAVVEDSTDNVAPPPVVEMAASDQASSSMSRGKKRRPVISEAPPLDPVVPEVAEVESGEKETTCSVKKVVDDESGEKEQRNGKTAPGKKTTRAAAVHNLSERKRRDKINERMKTLQELIPKCNKVDKASMLDEAIEYVKSLQNQVKAMSVKMNSMNSVMYTAAPGVPYYTPMGMNLTMMMGAEMAAAGRYAQPMIHCGQVFPHPQVPRVPQVVLNPSSIVSPVMPSSSSSIPDQGKEQAPGQPDPALNFTFINAPNMVQIPSTNPDLEAHVFAELKSSK